MVKISTLIKLWNGSIVEVDVITSKSYLCKFVEKVEDDIEYYSDYSTSITVPKHRSDFEILYKSKYPEYYL